MFKLSGDVIHARSNSQHNFKVKKSQIIVSGVGNMNIVFVKSSSLFMQHVRRTLLQLCISS